MFAHLVIAAALLPLPQVAGESVCPPVVAPNPIEEHVLVAFNTQVEAYMNIHRHVEESLGIAWTFDDPEDMFAAMYSLQQGIREARPNAKRGAMFTADAAALVRGRLRRAMAACNYSVAEILAFLNEERERGARKPRINGPFPWELGSSMPPPFIGVLPALPGELQYRFADRDLVLVDVHADLVVDILVNALPAPTTQDRESHHP